MLIALNPVTVISVPACTVIQAYHLIFKAALSNASSVRWVWSSLESNYPLIIKIKKQPKANLPKIMTMRGYTLQATLRQNEIILNKRIQLRIFMTLMIILILSNKN